MTRTQADADTLYRRLEDGWDKIEAAEQNSQSQRFMEEFWMSLLREYEAVCQELQGHEEREQRAEQKGLL